MYNIAICDDEMIILNDMSVIIKNKFLEFGVNANYFITSNPEKLLNYLEEERVDVLFLDIDMPKINGMDIGEYLLNKKNDTLLIFVTSHDALVYKSFKYHPFGFIRKSHFNEEITQTLDSVVKVLKDKIDTLAIKTGNDVITIKLNEIMYFEGDQNYINLYTHKANYKFRETLGNLEKELGGKGFIRVHKGYLVNQKHVFIFNTKEIKLNNEILIPIGRSYSEIVKKQLMKYMR
ncbi:LytTR family DNA-binding domain-containing protein [Clostridium sp.]|uniref:LytR/AlgR family response regulator transcription factor n=1 Tax=Clostridium sp. TaxID=1506 RepID=UPI00260742FB|nr:LytTR family DNA-binding domain-containing protein [Clostridium sp.]